MLDALCVDCGPFLKIYRTQVMLNPAGSRFPPVCCTKQAQPSGSARHAPEEVHGHRDDLCPVALTLCAAGNHILRIRCILSTTPWKPVATNWGPLSEISVVRKPHRLNTRVSCSMTIFVVVFRRGIASGHLVVMSMYVRRNLKPPWKPGTGPLYQWPHVPRER